jgi:excisionase family DNA binding protein
MTSTDDELLTPSEVARMLGISVPSLARWAREEKLLPAVRTPGGFRRYRADDVRALVEERSDPERDQLIEDAVRLYEQGWNIRQVAAKFDCSYSVMHHILRKHTTLRPSSGGASPSRRTAP